MIEEAKKLRDILDNAAWHMSNKSWTRWAKEALAELEQASSEPNEFTRLGRIAVKSVFYIEGFDIHKIDKRHANVIAFAAEACDIIEQQNAENKQQAARIKELEEALEEINDYTITPYIIKDRVEQALKGKEDEQRKSN